jgi:hypothetical protein
MTRQKFRFATPCFGVIVIGHLTAGRQASAAGEMT